MRNGPLHKRPTKRSFRETHSFISGFKRRQGHWGGRMGHAGASLRDTSSFGSGGGGALQLFLGCLSLNIMQTTKPLTEAALQEARRQNAQAQLRRRYDELDKLTGKNAAERVEEVRQRRRAS